ncbi:MULTISPECIES: T9SS type B sorting domain-containing protein [Chryseobacterium]|uniref:T9SS type B sorting domain-containing protein n=1 Tax=Chryseobacterium TaxID=59732 RepID=UPI001BEC4061|nr:MULTISPECIES: gliding motility-associated C-terminal domain-containing protein [Chryseobacterium]MBT2621767.1 gliding motility-associated C-terminal domain-containing protein [Chryseobacterium sp. ISL-6]
MKKTLLFIAFLVSHIFFAQNNDCSTAIPICSNADITLTPTGTGNSDEGNAGCLGGENNSIWFTFSTLTAGTLTFAIDPVNNVDYDWALYGPNNTCAEIQTIMPLRCSYDSPSPGQYITGLNLTSLDTSEDAGTDNLGNPSDGMVKYIDVLPGQVYYLLVDQFSGASSQFSLTFGGSAGLLTPFGDPVLQPYPFVTPGPNHDGILDICNLNFDFSTLTSGILNGNPSFIIKYYKTATDALDDVNPIIGQTVVNPATTYTYVISYFDPTSPASFLNKCKEFGTIKFVDRSFTLTPGSLTSCSNNNSGTGTYDLSTADVGAGAIPGLTFQYYPSLADANNGTSEITNPYVYVAPSGSAYVKATNQFGCTAIAEIKLNFHPIVTVLEPTIRSCFIETNPSTALFNLPAAIVTSLSGTTKKYYPSMTDAVNATNEILPAAAAAYVAPNGVVYVRVSNSNNCFTVAKITLIVLPPVKSTVLVDKIICMEDRTTLDAGPGFASYLWSTGATTQAITDVPVGTYWVKLKTGECITTQTVTVHPTEQPVITNVDISTNTITVNVIGGTPPYKYSIDNINWQDSNVFNNIPRGDTQIYVKDSYDCEPIDVTVVVPNLINVITPNNDGINDVIDYSALAGKQNLVLSIFDRYGAKIFQADKTNGYKWDGTTNGNKKVSTGTYWYSVTWNENDKKNTPIKFSSWIMVKNRE